MKIFFVYSKDDARQLKLIDRVKIELATYVDEVVVMEETEAKEKFHVRATPALIPMCDHWQGEELLKEATDGKLLVTATAYKLSEEEDKALHQSETHRLDNMIKIENTKAIDDYTMELIEGGLM